MLLPPLKLSIWQTHRLKRAGGLEFTARIHFKDMSVRTRNVIIRGLETGVVDTWAYYGSGALLRHMLSMAGVFWITAKKRGYNLVRWEVGKSPPGFLSGIKRVMVADDIATMVKGGNSGAYKFSFNMTHFVLQTLRPQDHIPQLLIEYTATKAYKNAVAPYLKLVQEGGILDVRVG